MEPKLERKIGSWASISIVVGAVIGSGIFMKPAIMASQVDSPILLLLVWVVAGIISLFGGMINAEIGTILPNTGGQYVYLKHMYGEFISFIYGWASLIVINTAALAAISFVFASYVETFFLLPRFSNEIETTIKIIIPGIGTLYPLANIGVKILAAFLILLITFINYRSLKASSLMQVYSTFLKILSLIFVVVIVFSFGNGSTNNFVYSNSTNEKSFFLLLGGFIAATSGALASYDGWNNLGFVSEEIINPKKNIPLGLLVGITICMVLYILTNQAYLYLLPINELKQSSLVASDVLQIAVGPIGAKIIAILVLISTFGAVNGNALPCSRVTFAMGHDKLLPSWIGNVHPIYKTPGNALILQAIWACIFVFSGSFDMLTDLFVFATWIFYGFAAYGLFILRKKLPNADRKYKVWGYPIIPIIFILFSILFVGLTLYNDIQNFLDGKTEFINSVYGLILTFSGIPFYLYYKKRSVKADL
ncbi:MAG: amino acid permease [Bacteroidetes bacterium]|nr:amino acid permease [Bacteroidota bacterium]